MWNLRTLAECVLAAPQDTGINVGLARDLARAALEADAAMSEIAAKPYRAEEVIARLEDPNGCKSR